jgi:hypothetical protein
MIMSERGVELISDLPPEKSYRQYPGLCTVAELYILRDSLRNEFQWTILQIGSLKLRAMTFPSLPSLLIDIDFPHIPLYLYLPNSDPPNLGREFLLDRLGTIWYSAESGSNNPSFNPTPNKRALLNLCVLNLYPDKFPELKLV